MAIRRCSWTQTVGSLVLCCLAALPLAAAEKSPKKVFGEIQPDQALVYLIREGHMLGAALTVFVYADQQFLGTLKSNSYTFTYLPPGPYLLWAHPLGFTVSNTQVQLEAGKVYYFNVWNSFDPLDEATGPAFLKGIKQYLVPGDEDREKAKEQIAEDYAKAMKKAVNNLQDAPQVDDPARRQAHVAAWPQIDLEPYGILCIEEFVMADPEAANREKDYLVESVPARLANFVVDPSGAGCLRRGTPERGVRSCAGSGGAAGPHPRVQARQRDGARPGRGRRERAAQGPRHPGEWGDRQQSGAVRRQGAVGMGRAAGRQPRDPGPGEERRVRDSELSEVQQGSRGTAGGAQEVAGASCDVPFLLSAARCPSRGLAALP